MRLLTPENTPIDPSQITEAINVGVMDCSDPEQTDFLFPECMCWNAFNWPSAGLMIGDMYLEIPLNFRILTLDMNSGMVELVTVDDLIQHEYFALTMNPVLSFRPDYLPVRVHNVFQTPRAWFVPRLNKQNYIAVPIGGPEDYRTFRQNREQQRKAPLCVFVGDDQERVNVEGFHISAVL